MMLRTCLLFFMMFFVLCTLVGNLFAEERCTTKKDAYAGLTNEALTELLQLKSKNNKEGIDILVKKRKVFPLPEGVPIAVKEKKANGVYHFAVPAFQFDGWILEEDVDCTELFDIPNDVDYFPLQVGNTWEYKRVAYRDNKEKEDTIQRQITNKIENADGSVTFMSEGKPYIYKYNEAIVSNGGLILMKLPLKHGLRWHSKGKNTGEYILWIKDAGFTFNLDGTSYKDCLRIIARSEYHALMREHGTQYTAFETQSVYAPDVGLLQADSYELLKQNSKRTHTFNKKLVSFKADQPVAFEKKGEASRVTDITSVHSFRFPETQFIHPVLSPNEKWLIYFKRNTVWEKLYYTEVGKSEKNIVSVFPEKTRRKDGLKTIGDRVWSPDGNILAIEIELSFREHISFVDFSTGTPQLIETITGEKPVYVESTGDLLYLDEGNIKKKAPDSQPEHFILAGSHDNKVTGFQVAKDGTLLYTAGDSGNRSVYLTTLHNPGEKKLLFTKSKKEKPEADHAELSASYALSPNGKFVLFYLPKNGKKESPTVLFDLHTQEVVVSIPLQKRAVWSPDGNMLAYLENTSAKKVKDQKGREVRPNPRFFIYNVLTGKTTDCGITVFGDFNWDPQSNYIIYSRKF